jgi:hypothetical protein
MSENDESVPVPAPETAAEPRPAPRRWQPPHIRSGQLFEANSLACEKADATGGDPCLMDPQS